MAKRVIPIRQVKPAIYECYMAGQGPTPFIIEIEATDIEQARYRALGRYPTFRLRAIRLKPVTVFADQRCLCCPWPVGQNMPDGRYHYWRNAMADNVYYGGPRAKNYPA